MKKCTLACMVVLIMGIAPAWSQDDPAYAEKVSSVDSIILNLYGVISGEKGEERNWELFEYLFHPQAKLIPTRKNQEGITMGRFMTPGDYVDSSGKWLVENGFFEKEIHRETETFGGIAQVFSTYESYHSEKEETPFMRGINSIQLMYDGERWWIMNVFWASETEDHPIPENYLPKS